MRLFPALAASSVANAIAVRSSPSCRYGTVLLLSLQTTRFLPGSTWVRPERNRVQWKLVRVCLRVGLPSPAGKNLPGLGVGSTQVVPNQGFGVTGNVETGDTWVLMEHIEGRFRLTRGKEGPTRQHRKGSCVTSERTPT